MELMIENLTKRFGELVALDNVSLSLKPGVYGLLGPNGAGKSTMINLIVDNLKRDTGDITWNGKDILQMGKEFRSVLGYMPQGQGYYEEYTVYAFLEYIASLKGMKKKEINERIDSLLEWMNLKDRKYTKVGNLSGGMRQRLLLAQALLNNPQVLILDEPTAGVDPQERINIRNLISEIAEERIIILATHIVSDVEAIANRIVLLSHGKIIETGTPGELIGKIRPFCYETVVDREKVDELKGQYLISNLAIDGDGMRVRIIAKEKPIEGEWEAKPNVNLEDVYLYYMQE